MSNPYPRESELRKIQKWDFQKKPVTLFLEYIRALWTYDDRFVLEGKRVLKLYLSTGGWSGNESLIEAMRRNFIFWGMSWVKSERGGHYWFEIKLKDWWAGKCRPVGPRFEDKAL
ncbi:MAG: hypothetical protein Q8P59_07225 [Dehalococcoidia bacterium]|nr:hypothetical protein [Dehalococcoidia bacterium]